MAMAISKNDGNAAEALHDGEPGNTCISNNADDAGKSAITNNNKTTTNMATMAAARTSRSKALLATIYYFSLVKTQAIKHESRTHDTSCPPAA